MNELQGLATRLCSFPAQNAEPVAAIVDQNYTPDQGRSTHSPGNWRIAAQNIEDDLDFFTDAQAASH